LGGNRGRTQELQLIQRISSSGGNGGKKLAEGLSKGAELLGLAAGRVALGKGEQALRGKKGVQRADGRVEVVDNPTYGQSAAERAAKPGEVAGERVTPQGSKPPPEGITPAPKPTEPAPGYSAG
jgi:hypothetical protein